MADDVTNPRRSTLYGGATYVGPLGLGAGGYLDQYGNLYPQVAVGTPGLSVSMGEATDLDKYLTGASLYAGTGGVNVGWNPEASALEASPTFKIGTLSAGATYGFGPYNLRKLPSLLYPGPFEPRYPLP